jgi:hypothetical protein
VTFSTAVNPGSRLKSWKTYPIERRRIVARSAREALARSTPFTST